ncbi:MAG TPA: TIM44-like domain-containing protein [Xanthobacteraceae bacterium]|nr:TIM44-like domain-containing protein [Xanthobacteraceae bacterium]
MMRFRVRPLLAIMGLLAALALTVGEADARMGGGKGFGSRGSRTFTPPPATRTAPTAQPFDRTMTQPAQPSAPRAAAAAQPTRPGWLNRPGLLGGLAAGFLGAGLLGLLFGHGFFGGLAGLASIIGLLVQVGLIAALGWLVWNWWQRRAQPQAALAGAGAGTRPEAARAEMTAAPAPASAAGGTFLHSRPAPSAPSDEIGLTPADYDTFERRLSEIQAAYSAEDTNTLRACTTPEMFGYLSEELSENASRGRVAMLSGVKLLQGDLSEAWREGNVEYATVAMRYSLVDQMLDRRTRDVIEGEPEPIEVTELWTFMRARGGDWLLSAIQQPEDEEG